MRKIKSNLFCWKFSLLHVLEYNNNFFKTFMLFSNVYWTINIDSKYCISEYALFLFKNNSHPINNTNSVKTSIIKSFFVIFAESVALFKEVYLSNTSSHVFIFKYLRRTINHKVSLLLSSTSTPFFHREKWCFWFICDGPKNTVPVLF